MSKLGEHQLIAFSFVALGLLTEPVSFGVGPAHVHETFELALPSTLPPLTLAHVLASVDTHFPLVIGAIQDREKAKGDLLSAKGGFDPVLRSSYQVTPSGEYENRYFDAVIEQPTPLWGTKAFAGYRNGQGNFGPYDQRLLTKNDGEVRAGLEVPILRGGFTDERRARIGSAERGVESAEQGIELQKLDSRRQASYRYFEWVAAAERLKVAQSLLKLALDRDEAMGHRVARGDAARIEQTDNQRSVNQRQAALVFARRAFEKAQLELSLFYRNTGGQPQLAAFSQTPADGFEVPPPGATEFIEQNQHISEESLALRVLPQHPEVLRLQTLLAQNDIERSLSRNFVLPRLDAEFAVSQDFGLGSSMKGIFEYKAALKLEFPLLLRTARGRSDAAIAQGVKLDTQLDFARDRIRVAISDASQALEATQKRIFLAQSEVELSLKVEQAERIKFKHGDSNILTVNLREQATADARSRTIDALADFHRAKADLAAATATNKN